VWSSSSPDEWEEPPGTLGTRGGGDLRGWDVGMGTVQRKMGRAPKCRQHGGEASEWDSEWD
jgi:hypothetical protein